MSIYVGNSEPKEIYIGTTPVKEVYVGTTKVRPSIQPITTAGIYWSSELGLISLSSDGTTRYTIADKNLGATTVWNDGDTFSEANCGKNYQRGNNYGFPFAGSVTTSSSQVNVNNYGPGNYYNSSTFITQSSRYYNWAYPNNDDLRGNTTNTKVARRGPCPEGYHLFSLLEMDAFRAAITALGITNVSTYLKMPRAPGRWNDGAFYSNTGRLWTSSPSGNYAVSYVIQTNNATADYGKVMGFQIRPFKNEAVQPDTSRTKLN